MLTKTRQSSLVGVATGALIFALTGPARVAAEQPSTTLSAEIDDLREMIAVQSLRLDRTEQEVVEQAQIIDAQRLRIRDLEAALNLPPADIAGLARGVHIVERGDTLFRLARRYTTSVAVLQRLNDIDNPARLEVGRRLLIPSEADAASRRGAPPVRIASAKPEATASGSDQSGVAGASEPAPPSRTASDDPAHDATAQTPPQEVGQRPETAEAAPYVALFSDVGGILTPRGAFIAESEFAFTTTSDNRFFFQGAEILDAILIGVIEATDADRTALTARLGGRFGVTDRLEIDLRAPYVYREDRVTGIAIGDNDSLTRDVDGEGFGDLEAGVHYQLNRGVNWPYAIINLRAKAPTGEGPFEVPRDENGVERDLATGSGFWTLEPSLTLIAPSAPASIFANIGYQANLETSPNALVGARRVLDFNPGDALRASLGVGLSLNERFSINLGFAQSYFFETQTRFRDPEGALLVSRQPTASVGAFNFGGSYALENGMRINVNAAIGATDEAPDVNLSLRVQKQLFD